MKKKKTKINVCFSWFVLIILSALLHARDPSLVLRLAWSWLQFGLVT